MRQYVVGGVVAAAGAALWGAGPGELRPSAASAAPPLAAADVDRVRAVVRPQPGEDAYDAIPWQVSLWEAREKAAVAGKPVLLWEMDGHPLGCG